MVVLPKAVVLYRKAMSKYNANDNDLVPQLQLAFIFQLNPEICVTFLQILYNNIIKWKLYKIV